MRIKEECGHGSEDENAHCVWSEKEEVPPKRRRESSQQIGRERRSFLRRDFGNLEVQMGVGDVTSPIVILGTTDFGNDWGERAWDRVSGQGGTSFGK